MQVLSSRAQSMMIRSSECMAALGEKALGERQHMETLFGMLADTPQRAAAAEAHQARSADLDFAVRAEPVWEAYCEIRADLADTGAEPGDKMR